MRLVAAGRLCGEPAGNQLRQHAACVAAESGMRMLTRFGISRVDFDYERTCRSPEINESRGRMYHSAGTDDQQHTASVGGLPRLEERLGR